MKLTGSIQMEPNNLKQTADAKMQEILDLFKQSAEQTKVLLERMDRVHQRVLEIKTKMQGSINDNTLTPES
jgi:hypothetical protein